MQKKERKKERVGEQERDIKYLEQKRMKVKKRKWSETEREKER